MEKQASYTKQHSLRNVKQMHDFKVKISSFDYNSNLGDGDLAAAGFSWPPRSYICSFCKREFRSAQALGGHMNVHRRDRARLRQSPARDGGNINGGQFNSLLNLNLEPNPGLCSNPNSCPSFFPSSPPTLSSLVTKFPQFTSKLPPPSGGDAVPVQYGRPITADLMKLKAAKGLGGVERFKKECDGFVNLELGIGLISPSMEEIDLDLRLGCN